MSITGDGYTHEHAHAHDHTNARARTIVCMCDYSCGQVKRDLSSALSECDKERARSDCYCLIYLPAYLPIDLYEVLHRCIARMSGQGANFVTRHMTPRTEPACPYRGGWKGALARARRGTQTHVHRVWVRLRACCRAGTGKRATCRPEISMEPNLSRPRCLPPGL